MSTTKQFGAVKSASYIELNSILAKQSNESNSSLSFKSCDIEDFHYKNNNIIIENRPSVKALVEKLNSIAVNTNNSYTSLDLNKINKCRPNSPKTESLDPIQNSLDTGGDFVMQENTEQTFTVDVQSDLLVKNEPHEIIKYEDKTTVLDLGVVDEELWRNVLEIMYTNQAYYSCLKNIADADKHQKLKDVTGYANSVLESVNELERDEREWIIAYAEQILNGLSIDREQCTRLSCDTCARNLAVQNELQESKQHVNNLKNKVAILRKEKRDLLNIIKSYESERVNKLSLEKRLQAEQMKNDELRNFISSVYEEKFRSVSL